MGFRARKSIKIAKGVKLNLSKSGVGVSVGGRGARYSVHSSGRRTTSVGIPGTGLGYTSTKSPKRSNRGRPQGTPPSTGRRPTQTRAPRAPAQPTPTKPAMLAPKAEKLIFKALQTTPTDVSSLQRVATEFPDWRMPALALGAVTLIGVDNGTARSLLAEVVASGYGLATDSRVLPYVGSSTASVPIANGVTAALPLDWDGLGLILAELHQEAGDLAAAIDVVERLTPTTVAALSLAELYTQAGRTNDVIDLTNGLTNQDDVTALLVAYRGAALARHHMYTAGREAFKEALKSSKRDPAIRHYALMERAYLNHADGKRAQARKDLERILAENSAYPGLREMLSAVQS